MIGKICDKLAMDYYNSETGDKVDDNPGWNVVAKLYHRRLLTIFGECVF